MMSLAIGVNLLPVFLTSLSLTFGGQDGLSQEQLGRLGAISFIGLVLGILIAGPASDRWGAKILAIAGNGIMVFSLIAMSLAPGYGNLGVQIKSHAAGNLKVGNSRETLVAAITFCLPFIGFPRTLNAPDIVKEVSKE
jgi:MFS family permease